MFTFNKQPSGSPPCPPPHPLETSAAPPLSGEPPSPPTGTVVSSPRRKEEPWVPRRLREPRLTCENHQDREGQDLHGLGLRQPLQLEQQPVPDGVYLLHELAGCHAAPGPCWVPPGLQSRERSWRPRRAGSRESALSPTPARRTSLSGLAHQSPVAHQGGSEPWGPSLSAGTAPARDTGEPEAPPGTASPRRALPAARVSHTCWP